MPLKKSPTKNLPMLNSDFLITHQRPKKPIISEVYSKVTSPNPPLVSVYQVVLRSLVQLRPLCFGRLHSSPLLIVQAVVFKVCTNKPMIKNDERKLRGNKSKMMH